MRFFLNISPVILITKFMSSFDVVSIQNPSRHEGVVALPRNLDSTGMVCHLSRAPEEIDDEGFGKLLEDGYRFVLHGDVVPRLLDDLVDLWTVGR